MHATAVFSGPIGDWVPYYSAGSASVNGDTILLTETDLLVSTGGVVPTAPATSVMTGTLTLIGPSSGHAEFPVRATVSCR
jgi:hypothetical protein